MISVGTQFFGARELAHPVAHEHGVVHGSRRPHISLRYQALPPFAFCSSLPTPPPQQCVSGVGKVSLQIEQTPDLRTALGGGGGPRTQERDRGCGTGTKSGRGVQ